jgi:uncharacterized membrane protein YfbV (UPF0208 family)
MLGQAVEGLSQRS